MTDTKPNNVYQCIAAVMADLAKDGISKDRKNQQQGYSFRGIDDVYNALAPALVKNGLVIVPRLQERTSEWHKSDKGSQLNYAIVRVTFVLVAAANAESFTEVSVAGEAMDSGDKATNKAMSAAYKYMAMQVFCIPTEGDNDADATTHTVAPAARPHPAGEKPFEGIEETSAFFAQCADMRQLNIGIQRVQATQESKYPLKGEDLKTAQQACKEAKQRLAEGATNGR